MTTRTCSSSHVSLPCDTRPRYTSSKSVDAMAVPVLVLVLVLGCAGGVLVDAWRVALVPVGVALRVLCRGLRRRSAAVLDNRAERAAEVSAVECRKWWRSMVGGECNDELALMLWPSVNAWREAGLRLGFVRRLSHDRL